MSELIRGNFKKPCACGCEKIIWHFGRHKHINHYSVGHGRVGRHPSNYQGGHTSQYGYKYISVKGHPRAVGDGHRVFEHIVVYEKHHKCCVLKWGIVHHKNGNKLDNRVRNLSLIGRSKHAYYHGKKKVEMGIPLFGR